MIGTSLCPLSSRRSTPREKRFLGTETATHLNDIARFREGEAPGEPSRKGAPTEPRPGVVKSWSYTASALMPISLRLPSPLVGEGWAGGRLGNERRGCVPNHSTPHVNPPPQGGRTPLLGARGWFAPAPRNKTASSRAQQTMGSTATCRRPSLALAESRTAT
jgi:hypothetical protein